MTQSDPKKNRALMVAIVLLIGVAVSLAVVGSAVYSQWRRDTTAPGPPTGPDGQPKGQSPPP